MFADTSKLTRLEQMDRQEHFDADGGGSIVRTFYCEPYTAHKTLLTALKGTVYSEDETVYKRLKPHNDPLYTHFYCNDVKCVPLDKSTITACKSTGFDPEADDPILHQIPAVQSALNNIDDFDFANHIDSPNLSTGQIEIGGALPNHTAGRVSQGRSGAIVVATYRPLTFLSGFTAEYGFDEFDFVDPQWRPITKHTQTGRNLFFYAKNPGLLGGNVLCNGLSDTFSVPEVMWEFTCRRLMVPFLPKKTINLFANKVNANSEFLGDIPIPRQTIRMETPEVIQKRAPDGVIYWEMLMKYTLRTLYHEFYDALPADFGLGPGAFVKGWVGWNHHYGIPTARETGGIAPVGRAGYYPVAWNGGLFQLFGANNPLYLVSTDADLGQISNGGAVSSQITVAPFQVGFRRGQ